MKINIGEFIHITVEIPLIPIIGDVIWLVKLLTQEHPTIK